MSAEQPILVESDDEETGCLQEVTDCFPDICPTYLRRVAKENQNDAGQTITAILDAEASGKPYERRTKRKEMKRKRESSPSDDEAQARKLQATYNNLHRRAEVASTTQIRLVETFLTSEFPCFTLKIIKRHMQINRNLLFPTYLDLFNAVYNDRSVLRKWEPFDLSQPPRYSLRALRHDDAIKKEFQSARSICVPKWNKVLVEEAHEKAERDNFEEAQRGGQVAECGCCFDQFALNRLVQCDGETVHFCCRDCLRQHAEHQIGLAKFELTCISIAGCKAGFSVAERSKFLSEDMAATLDRIETESALRGAEIDDLVMCPFCPYAAICPPIEIDKEFRCLNPECEIVSCRHCKAETHLPKSCQDMASEGSNARRKVEEAMSTALIRKCNKCGTAFIKSSGCNKMTCPRSGCLNVQCYVCSKSCGYEHFNDPARGGKKGGCPLWDNVLSRHEEEVKQAEIKTKEQIIKDNPSIRPELLEMKTPTVAAPKAQKENDIPREPQYLLHGGRRPLPRMAELMPWMWPPIPEAVMRAQQMVLPRPAPPLGAVAPGNLPQLAGGAGREQLQRQPVRIQAIPRAPPARPESVAPRELEKRAVFNIPPPIPPALRTWRPLLFGLDALWGGAAPNANNELLGAQKRAEGID